MRIASTCTWRLRFIGGLPSYSSGHRSSSLDSEKPDDARCRFLRPGRDDIHRSVERAVDSQPRCAQTGLGYLFELLDFEDIIRLLTARFSMNSNRCISTRRDDQTEHSAARRVIPVLHHLHAMRGLDCQVLRVNLSDVVRGYTFGQDVAVQEQWHHVLLRASWSAEVSIRGSSRSPCCALQTAICARD